MLFSSLELCNARVRWARVAKWVRTGRGGIVRTYFAVSRVAGMRTSEWPVGRSVASRGLLAEDLVQECVQGLDHVGCTIGRVEES
jgi:hypothetical protein